MAIKRRVKLMSEKPTYEELEQRVREFEAEGVRRKRAEEALRASEAKLVDNLKNNYFLYSHNLDGDLTYVSPTITNVLGYSREEFIANFREYQTDNPINNKNVCYPDRAVMGGELPSYEIEIYHKNGSLHWLEIAEVPVFDEAGQVVAVEGIVQDITDRKGAEVSLLQEKNKLEAVFATIGDGLVIQDLDFKIIYQNQPHKEKFGDHLGEYCFVAYHGRKSPCEPCPLEKCFTDGKVHKEEKTTNHGKQLRYLEISAGPIKDARGKMIAGFEIVRDITEHKNLAAQFMQAQKMESVGRLAGGVAHDFNNLLTGIIGYAELSAEGLEERSPARADLGEILKLSKRAANLTRQLLAFSRQQTMEPQEVNINLLISDLAKMLKRLIGEDIKLEFLAAPELETVKADPGQMEQILTNLAVNARDAMPNGGNLTIRTENISLTGPDDSFENSKGRIGNYVMFSMADTGCGMDIDTMERIFEPFFTTKEIGEGSGLGLSTVYGIVKQHNGFVRVSSQVGRGTMFKVFLPRFEGEPQADEDEPVTASGRQVILLVEDDENVRNVTQRMLANLGYSVLVTSDPAEAEAVFEQNAMEIDLLLTDVVMPKKNGKELYVTLASKAPSLKVLFMSGYSRDILFEKGSMLDQDVPLIGKPFSQEKLGKKIKQVLA